MTHFASVIGKYAGRIDHALKDPVPMAALGLFRAAFGTVFFIWWLTRFRAAAMLYSAEGIVIPLIDRGVPDAFLYLLQPPDAAGAWILYIVLLGAFACIAVGVQTRIMSAVALFISLYFWLLSTHLYPTSMSAFQPVILFLLMFSPADLGCSLTMLWRHGSVFAYENASPFIHYLIAFHVMFLYMGVGWLKIPLPAWSGGEVLYYAFQSGVASGLAFWIVRLDLPMWLYDIAVFAVKVWECSLPVGIWIRWLRPWYIGIGILFHTANGLLFGFWSFMVLPFAYPLFYPPRRVAFFFDRLQRHQYSLADRG